MNKATAQRNDIKYLLFIWIQNIVAGVVDLPELCEIHKWVRYNRWLQYGSIHTVRGAVVGICIGVWPTKYIKSQIIDGVVGVSTQSVEVRVWWNKHILIHRIAEKGGKLKANNNKNIHICVANTATHTHIHLASYEDKIYDGIVFTHKMMRITWLYISLFPANISHWLDLVNRMSHSQFTFKNRTVELKCTRIE